MSWKCLLTVVPGVCDQCSDRNNAASANKKQQTWVQHDRASMNCNSRDRLTQLIVADEFDVEQLVRCLYH